MSARPVWIHAGARKELRRAVKRYEAEAPGLGEEFASEVEQTVKYISERPASGSPHLLGTRRVLTPRFPYSIIYRAETDPIVVLAIAHQRRRPDYWLRRV